MPFLDFRLLLSRKLTKHFSQRLAQFLVQNFTPVLRNENDVVFAVPGRVA
jgi:hypothetical protein